MIPIDFHDARPIYEQVFERFRLLIVKGVLSGGERIPSVRSLAVELSVNPNTIQRAYTELEKQGYIYTQKGKGNFVSDSGELVLRYKKEILDGMKEAYHAALSLGVTEEEILEQIKGWKNHD